MPLWECVCSEKTRYHQGTQYIQVKEGLDPRVSGRGKGCVWGAPGSTGRGWRTELCAARLWGLRAVSGGHDLSWKALRAHPAHCALLRTPFHCRCHRPCRTALQVPPLPGSRRRSLGGLPSHALPHLPGCSSQHPPSTAHLSSSSLSANPLACGRSLCCAVTRPRGWGGPHNRAHGP